MIGHILKKSAKFILIIGGSTVLATLAINAVDNGGIFERTLLGGMLAANQSQRCPTGMVYAGMNSSGFCIDAYEASASPACVYDKPANQLQTRQNLESANCTPRSEARIMPWRNISQDQATVACAKAGKRLPTEEEWYHAALGTPDPDSNWNKDDCNVRNNWTNETGPAGSAARCRSIIGAYDMIGNVWEWTSGAIRDGTYDNEILPAKGFISGTNGKGLPGETHPNEPDANYNKDYFWIVPTGIQGIMRGGYWNNGADAGFYSVHAGSAPSFASEGVGFRCAANLRSL